ncbi:flagellar biosynthesis anti-sigma factor FlgM [Thioalkalivibrio denitrificans]|uniref:Negative regulator of flagellin synthesis n=1 Tax=Thioalkalivibrio denitrificans TaxID=108003 RepID=A0A1V3NQV6_9GAMM|nr:flagellar biosynthesis anti-sigma factor FlgM [Thioalkalivibrio denitrificans]OOG27136.1 flagellar biosynthesis anti-sigma factor FlgM [Thioalkalivibrio denitrificans]
MSIDIKNLSQSQPRATGDGRAVNEHRGARGSEGDSRSGQGVATDQVTLTDTARRLSDVVQTVAAQPVVNKERVEQIRQAIQEGRYEVSAERVAEKLMKTEELL